MKALVRKKPLPGLVRDPTALAAVITNFTVPSFFTDANVEPIENADLKIAKNLAVMQCGLSQNKRVKPNPACCILPDAKFAFGGHRAAHDLFQKQLSEFHHNEFGLKNLMHLINKNGMIEYSTHAVAQIDSNQDIGLIPHDIKSTTLKDYSFTPAMDFYATNLFKLTHLLSDTVFPKLCCNEDTLNNNKNYTNPNVTIVLKLQSLIGQAVVLAHTVLGLHIVPCADWKQNYPKLCQVLHDPQRNSAHKICRQVPIVCNIPEIVTCLIILIEEGKLTCKWRNEFLLFNNRTGTMHFEGGHTNDWSDFEVRYFCEGLTEASLTLTQFLHAFMRGVCLNSSFEKIDLDQNKITDLRKLVESKLSKGKALDLHKFVDGTRVGMFEQYKAGIAPKLTAGSKSKLEQSSANVVKEEEDAGKGNDIDFDQEPELLSDQITKYISKLCLRSETAWVDNATALVHTQMIELRKSLRSSEMEAAFLQNLLSMCQGMVDPRKPHLSNFVSTVTESKYYKTIIKLLIQKNIQVDIFLPSTFQFYIDKSSGSESNVNGFMMSAITLLNKESDRQPWTWEKEDEPEDDADNNDAGQDDATTVANEPEDDADNNDAGQDDATTVASEPEHGASAARPSEQRTLEALKEREELKQQNSERDAATQQRNKEMFEAADLAESKKQIGENESSSPLQSDEHDDDKKRKAKEDGNPNVKKRHVTSSNSRNSIVCVDSSSSESSDYFNSDTPLAEMQKKSLLTNRTKTKKTSPKARKEQLKDVPARRSPRKNEDGKGKSPSKLKAVPKDSDQVHSDTETVNGKSRSDTTEIRTPQKVKNKKKGNDQ